MRCNSGGLSCRTAALFDFFKFFTEYVLHSCDFLPCVASSSLVLVACSPYTDLNAMRVPGLLLHSRCRS